MQSKKYFSLNQKNQNSEAKKKVFFLPKKLVKTKTRCMLIQSLIELRPVVTFDHLKLLGKKQ